ncbi:3'(2'),5'-bisphosphate nucleotidase CysQ [Sediminitomix flava]|uniref:3'(2'),5'-bisphosphate nucleotidase CysQ n=1 Tax=Sediminitomix flava TaxID=379075 RepID=A0A315Z8A1_SEDFL|nr:3'(2'),5'-bisphosphate nucleotidase CysQ [Sediminitomix flava]PWJ39410.1 3'(2'),5'-bisphosphate nucleotidase [Sediminitomix flava]
MTTQEIKDLIEVAIEATSHADKEILKVYESDDFGVEVKGDDSPLTKADKASHYAIVGILEKTGLPILSEEGNDISYEDRKDWEYFWMIDPLDGTKEFIKRSGEFTVNIALIHKDTPVGGVVSTPVLGEVFWGSIENGAFVKRNGEIRELSKSKAVNLNQKGLRVVASKSHLNDKTREYIEKLSEPETVSMGSSLKFLMLTEDKADLYPRFAPTMEWDTAAAHAVLSVLGYKVYNMEANGTELVYNKENLLNPEFLAI